MMAPRSITLGWPWAHWLWRETGVLAYRQEKVPASGTDDTADATVGSESIAGWLGGAPAGVNDSGR